MHVRYTKFNIDIIKKEQNFVNEKEILKINLRNNNKS